MLDNLNTHLAATAFAFRGYNVTNLGRTHELMAVPAYRDAVVQRLEWANRVCREELGRSVDLVGRVERQDEPSLEDYAEAVAIVFAVELAQIELLRTVHGVDMAGARMAFGYSLGELTAVCAGGRFYEENVLRVPLAMAADCAELAHDVRMAIVFSRGEVVNEQQIIEACNRITASGHGAIGVSAVLSPNTYLVLGQGDTIDAFRDAVNSWFPRGVHFRLNDAHWPPLHTIIVRQRNIPDRASVMMQTMGPKADKPHPPVVSLVTGKVAYDSVEDRELLRKWVDHPQRLWDTVCTLMAANVRVMVHVGPAPNLIPATFQRLSDNIRQQVSKATLGSLGMRAAQNMVNRPWLGRVLPARTSLLRAPAVRHVILEDWLLEHAPK